jgi:hypothetical protein
MTEQTITGTDIASYTIVQIREQGVGCLWWISTCLHPIVSLRSGTDHELGLRGRKHNLISCAWIANSDPNSRVLVPNEKEKSGCVRHNVTKVADYSDATWNTNIWLVAGKFSRTFNQKKHICLRMSQQFGVKFRMLLWSDWKLNVFLSL